MMSNKRAAYILTRLKNYYSNKDFDQYVGYTTSEIEATNMAIDLLEKKDEKGYTHQKLDRDLFKEIMSNADKMCAFVQLQRGIHNFIEVMKDIDIQVDIQTKRGD